LKFFERKRVLLGLFLLLTGAGAVFLWKVASRTQERAVQPKAEVKDNPAHELKELGVQLQKKPGHTPILMRIAQIEHDQGKLEDATGHLREVVKNEPNNADAHVELGRVLYEKGDREAGVAETQNALAINPKHVDALYNLGAMYANAGDTARARSYWRSAIEADPRSDSGQQARQGLAKLAETQERKH
jgi:cytochrome c-type biogenesis protein CcmH/NrfG